MNQILDTLSVLHISTAFTWRGGEQQLAYLAGELHAKGLRQYVLCVQGSEMASWCERSGIPFFTARKRSSMDLFFARKIADLCRINAIQLIHVHDSHAHSFAVYSAVLFGNRTKIIVSRRVDFPVKRNFFSLLKYNHSQVARILCVSDKIRRVTETALKDPSKLVTVHSGIDVSRFEGKRASGILKREFGFADDCRLVLNVSALAPHKDHGTFISVAVRLLQQNDAYRFLLVGEGGQREMLEAMIREHGLEGKVVLTGFRSDIPEILPEAGVMLMTSETEGLGTTILDAFACAVPVVATAAGGIPELVIHEQTGMLSDVRDVAGLAQNVDRVFSENGLREKLVGGAREHLRQFSKSATAAATLREYVAVTGTAL